MTFNPGRLLTAMATPFSANGSLDLDGAKRLASALLDSGTEGLVICGTTGESPTLSNQEKLALLEATCEVAHRRNAAIIAGTTTYNTAESIELSREAAHLGVDGILGTVPYYNNPPQEGLFQHFSAIARAVDLPMILYNIPSRSPRNMEAATTLRLAREVSNIVGVKEASANFKQIGEIIHGAPDGFRVWSGNDADILTIMSLGGYGVVSVAAHLVGRQIAALMNAFVAGDNARAAEIHHSLMPFVDALFVTSSPIPLKYALGKAGMNVGSCRLPLVAIDAKSQSIMDAALAGLRVDLPVAVPV
ncbi:MAG: 4-hydroxy-tetrahydrodipicolinate synthase [Chloroflexi bacterium]|nr:4-hydroxy-tetrahydrodipicolinate synthase [Chloroflexota bacterium]MBV9895138.1 4-hydroxy-tetrahydrodipicolinate synthase [Chloroflexota bacterium]